MTSAGLQAPTGTHSHGGTACRVARARQRDHLPKRIWRSSTRGGTPSVAATTTIPAADDDGCPVSAPPTPSIRGDVLSPDAMTG